MLGAATTRCARGHARARSATRTWRSSSPSRTPRAANIARVRRAPGVRSSSARPAGTTQLPTRRRARCSAAGGALLWAPNFSVGVTLFVALAARGRRASAARARASTRTSSRRTTRRRRTRRRARRIALARAARAALGADDPDHERARRATCPGTHELSSTRRSSRSDSTHEARDRRVFADGALRRRASGSRGAARRVHDARRARPRTGGAD